MPDATLSPTSQQAFGALTVNTYAIKRFIGSGPIHCCGCRMDDGHIITSTQAQDF
jgi:hypothetical protein